MKSIKELKKLCQDQHGTWFNRHIERKVSIYITWLFLHTSITANQVSILGLLIGILAGLLLSSGKLLIMVIGGIVMIFADLFDSVDGEIARYRKQTSLEGIYLDDLCKSMTEIICVLGFSFGVWRATGQIWVSYMGLSFLVFYICHKELENRIFSTAFARNKNAWEQGKHLSGKVLSTSPFPKQSTIGRSENFFIKCFLWVFGIFPSCGKFYHFGIMLILIPLVCLFDWAISLTNFANSIISTRLLLVIFYGVLLPISFFLRLYKVITTRAVTNWFMTDNRKVATND